MRNFEFAEDFVTLHNEKFFSAPASNLTELWTTVEKRRLLCVWSMTAGADEPLFSAYDQFRALCQMMPMLKGHSAQRHCRFFLKACFDCDHPMDEAHCEDIWHMIAEELLHAPMSVADLLAKKNRPRWILWESDPVGYRFPDGLRPMLSAKRLLAISARNWDEWRIQADKILDDFSSVGCCRVHACVPDGYAFSSPNLYAVNQALETEKRGVTERAILFSQTLRYLFEACIKRGWKMQLDIGECASSAIALLQYCKKTVGLVPIFWMTPSLRAADEMLALLDQAQDVPILPLLRIADYPSETELKLALAAYAARYPIGLLHFASGGDLVDADADRERLRQLQADG